MTTAEIVQYSGATGWRAYAIGDVHGHADLLGQLLSQIHRDHDSRPSAKLLIVMLGDVIDRGPHSRGVIELLRNADPKDGRLVCLMGNHEEVLLRILNGERGLVQDWLLFGGAECLRSYGADPRKIGAIPEKEAVTAIQRIIPADHAAFLASFADTLRFGDYLFVHAGVRPGVAMDQQRQVDLRWIRGDFLHHDAPLDVMVVHGHTIAPSVDERIHRIGIDTGAYRTGRLTALAIEEGERWFLSTVD